MTGPSVQRIPDSKPARSRRAWSKRAPVDVAWDTIVIGSGMGGAMTAGLLAKLGQRVLVLEQHYVPGGFTHTFRRNGYVWDVGVHLVGDTALRALPGRVMQLLSGGQLQWRSVGEAYDELHFPGDFHLTLSSDPVVFIRDLKAAFPESADQVDAWRGAIREIAAALGPWHLSHLVPGAVGRWLSEMLSGGLQHTAADKLAALVPDERLRTVLSAQWGYHGVPPSRAAWALQAMVSNHFMQGASYPVGGSGRLAATFLQGVADAGGWTRVCADVAEILVEDGRTVGVCLTDGEELRAPRVVSAAGAWNTTHKLLPAAHRGAPWVASVAALPPSPAHVCLYIGFKGDIASAGASRRCAWYFDTWSHERCTWEVDAAEPPSRPPLLFVSFPSLKDPAHVPGPEQRHTGELIAFVPWEAFERWSGTP